MDSVAHCNHASPLCKHGLLCLAACCRTSAGVSCTPVTAPRLQQRGHACVSAGDSLPLPQLPLPSRDSDEQPLLQRDAPEVLLQPLPDPPGGGTGLHYTYEPLYAPLQPISETDRPAVEAGLELRATASRVSRVSSAAAGSRSLPGGSLLSPEGFADPFDGLHEGSPTKPVPGRQLRSPRLPSKHGGEAAIADSDIDSSRGSSPATVSLSPPGLARAAATESQQPGGDGDVADSESPGSPPPIRRPPGYYAELMQRGRAPVQWPPDNTVEVFRIGTAELPPGHPELSADFPNSDSSGGETERSDRALLEPRHGAGEIATADGRPDVAHVGMHAWRRHTLEDVLEDSAELGRVHSHDPTGSPVSAAPQPDGHGPVGEACAGMATHRTRSYAHVHGLTRAPPSRRSTGSSAASALPPRPPRRTRHKSPLRRLSLCLCPATHSGFEAFSDELETPQRRPLVPALALGPLTQHKCLQPPGQRRSFDVAALSSGGSDRRGPPRHAPRTTAPPAVPRLRLEPRSRVGRGASAAADPAVKQRSIPLRQSTDGGLMRRSPSDSSLLEASPAHSARVCASRAAASLAGELFWSPRRHSGPGPIAEATVPGLIPTDSPNLQSVQIGVARVPPPQGAALARGRLDFELRGDLMEGKFARKLRPQVDYWGNKDLALMICRALLGRDVMDGCEYESVVDDMHGGAFFAA